MSRSVKYKMFASLSLLSANGSLSMVQILHLSFLHNRLDLLEQNYINENERVERFKYHWILYFKGRKTLGIKEICIDKCTSNVSIIHLTIFHITKFLKFFNGPSLSFKEIFRYRCHLKCIDCVQTCWMWDVEVPGGTLR